MLGGSQIIISSNAVLRNDGLPRSFQLRTDATGVAVYFLYEGKQVVIAYDKWFNISDNIRAIGLTIDPMRGMDRWGVSQMLKRTFAGFKAFPKRLPSRVGGQSRALCQRPVGRLFERLIRRK